MALGVEAAGVVAAAGASAGRFKPGDRVAPHSVPLREQGSWAEWLIVPAEHCAVLPPGVPFDGARDGAGDAVTLVRDGGRLATITGDPPPAERGITVLGVQVVPDGARLRGRVLLAARGVLAVSAAGPYPLEQADSALAQARHGARSLTIDSGWRDVAATCLAWLGKQGL